MIKFVKWSDDRWKSEQGSIIKYDKLEHFILGFIGLFVTLILGAAFWLSLAIWVTVGFGYELKDGTVPYDAKHIQGFSWKDFIADCLGFILAIIVWAIIRQVQHGG